MSPTLLLQLNLSPLCPHCHADEQIFLWKGINTPLASTIDNPTIQLVAALASHASLHDTSSYGSGLRKFYLFCNIFTTLESDRLPASFPLLHSLALWAATDPDTLGPDMAARVPLEPVSIGVVRKYLSTICTWHVAQGWPSPLSSNDYDRINWSLQGLENIKGSRKQPVRPPITISMLWALWATFNLGDPFEACILAMATCAFWGMMRFGEVLVTSCDTSTNQNISSSGMFTWELILTASLMPASTFHQSRQLSQVKSSQFSWSCRRDSALSRLLRTLPQWYQPAMMTHCFLGGTSMVMFVQWLNPRPLLISMQS
jgi:hypothetical protein